MSTWLWTIPLISTVSFWLLALFVRKTALGRIPQFVQQFTQRNDLLQTSDPTAIRNITPFVETHIDYFLRHKLGKAMPMIAMFIGDKTINQMKSVFMKELEELLPAVMEKYSSHILASIATKLTPILTAAIRKEMRLLPLAALTAGFITGILQMFVVTALI